MVAFHDVQTVLTGIIDGWKAGTHKDPDLIGHSTHRTAMFAWDTKANFLASTARGLPLVQPELKGVAGQGHNANIVLALTVGMANFPKMPLDGLDGSTGVYLRPDSAEIQTLVAWVEAGFPD